MSFLTNKLQSAYKIFIKNKPTKPYKMGDNLLILATAPSVRAFFEYESVREQFAGYDLAAVNFMLVKSEDLMHKYRPRYFILYDSIYFMESARTGIPDWMREDCYKMFEALERIDWDCHVITYQAGDWKINNPHIKFIYISVFNRQYNAFTKHMYVNNHANAGVNNVIIGTLYFGITFGYKNIAILGCPYRQLSFEMKPDGLHIYNHMHYYDEEPWEDIISYEDLYKDYPDGLDLYLKKRALKNGRSFAWIAKYAEEMGVKLINYSDGSQIVPIRQGALNVPEGTNISFIDDKYYKYL